jgi:lipopolysaccharide transport system ATP-binding protein
MNAVIKVENLSKQYRLGAIGGRTLREDINRWWARVQHKPDPTLKIGQDDHGNRDGEKIWALRDVNFEVQQGEVLGIIGRNGAGKSTLLKILSRITAPTDGTVKVKGRVGSLLEVGTGFHPELTGRENIYMNGAILGMSQAEIDAKFDEIVDFSGVETFINTPVKRYSSGMYVRLAFAVAAHLDPEILLVDEVLAVGDVEFQRKCLGKMSEVAKGGRTVLFVSHNMAAVKSLCERGILLQEGILGLDGNADKVVQSYLASLSKNSISGQILSDAPRLYSTGQAIFRSMTLTNSIGEESNRLYLGESFQIHLILEVFAEIPEAALEITIISADGSEVASVRTLDGDNMPITLHPGKHTISVDIDIFLLPREYSFLLIVHKFDGTVIDWIERALDFNVLNVSRDNADCYRYWPIMRGYVRASAKWKLPGDIKYTIPKNNR